MKKQKMNNEGQFEAAYVVPNKEVDKQISRRILNRNRIEDIEGSTPGTREIHTNSEPNHIQPKRNTLGQILSDVNEENVELDISLVSPRVEYSLFENAIDTEFTEFIQPPKVIIKPTTAASQSVPSIESITEPIVEEETTQPVIVADDSFLGGDSGTDNSNDGTIPPPDNSGDTPPDNSGSSFPPEEDEPPPPFSAGVEGKPPDIFDPDNP